MRGNLHAYFYIFDSFAITYQKYSNRFKNLVFQKFMFSIDINTKRPGTSS